MKPFDTSTVTGLEINWQAGDEKEKFGRQIKKCGHQFQKN